ncbi:MAG: MgtC/SapB family protein [Lachnospiraceae bacterium]|nr:MgtC/SapB family protein [Lachnospiraceae bacterium]
MTQLVKAWFADWNILSIIIRLVLSGVVGFLIGYDRERKNKPAGIRTHILVCLGTALATMTAMYALYMFPNTNIDITRLGGQMVAGIGFLGAGVIFISNKNRVEGLTTAAGLWACTCCGLAIGFGFLEGTIITVVLIIITMLLLPLFERNVRHNRDNFDLYIEFETGTSPAGFLRLLHSRDVSYSNYRVIQEDNGKEGPIVILSVSMNKSVNRDDFLAEVQALDGLKFLHEHMPRR